MEMSLREQKDYIEWIKENYELNSEYEFTGEDDFIWFKGESDDFDCSSQQSLDIEIEQDRVTDFFDDNLDDWLIEERESQNDQEDIERTQESDWAGSRGC